MHTYVVLLRAVNVGGTGKLPMTELRALCERAGLTGVRTYIASGNVVARSPHTAAVVKDALETALADHVGRPMGVVVRSTEELAAVLAANPFPQAAPNRVAAIFLDRPPTADALDGISGADNETVALGRCEIYVHYPDGMGRSRLRIPAAKHGTARNMNTVARLVSMAAET